MSGGSLDYFYNQLIDHVGDFDDVELDELIKDLSNLFKAREWYLSGDTGLGTWREERDKFKSKWFTEHGRNDRINSMITKMADKMRDALGVKESYCETCMNWTGDTEFYGRCKKTKNVYFHRREDCDKWEQK